MADVDPIAAREKRVLGVFVLMIGCGLILDFGCVWCGSTLIGTGMGLMAWGMTQTVPSSVPSTAAPTVSDSHP